MAYPKYILAGLAHVMMPIPVRARVASMGDGSSRIDTRYWTRHEAQDAVEKLCALHWWFALD